MEHNEFVSIPLGSTLEQAESALLKATLAMHGGNKEWTARTLGISSRTVYNLMEKYGLRRAVLAKVMRDV